MRDYKEEITVQQDCIDKLKAPLKEVISFLQETLNSIPSEYQDRVKISFRAYDDTAEADIEYSTPWTPDDERKYQEAMDAQRKAQIREKEERERFVLASLIQKYGIPEGAR